MTIPAMIIPADVEKTKRKIPVEGTIDVITIVLKIVVTDAMTIEEITVEKIEEKKDAKTDVLIIVADRIRTVVICREAERCLGKITPVLIAMILLAAMILADAKKNRIRNKSIGNFDMKKSAGSADFFECIF